MPRVVYNLPSECSISISATERPEYQEVGF